MVTDILPTVNGPERFTDGFDSSSFNAARDVTGLIDGETVSLDATSQPGSVIFTFHKNGQPGLYPVEGGRQISITLTTTLDEDWMAFEITGDHLRYYNTHTNTARVVANNYTIEDSAHITVNNTDPSMLKRMDEYMEDSFHWRTWDAGNNLKAWMYRLYLYGVSDDMFTDGYLEITDTQNRRHITPMRTLAWGYSAPDLLADSGVLRVLLENMQVREGFADMSLTFLTSDEAEIDLGMTDMTVNGKETGFSIAGSSMLHLRPGSAETRVISVPLPDSSALETLSFRFHAHYDSALEDSTTLENGRLYVNMAVSGDEGSMRLGGINFEIYGPDGTSGTFNIIGLGRYR